MLSVENMFNDIRVLTTWQTRTATFPSAKLSQPSTFSSTRTRWWPQKSRDKGATARSACEEARPDILRAGARSQMYWNCKRESGQNGTRKVVPLQTFDESLCCHPCQGTGVDSTSVGNWCGAGNLATRKISGNQRTHRTEQVGHFRKGSVPPVAGCRALIMANDSAHLAHRAATRFPRTAMTQSSHIERTPAFIQREWSGSTSRRLHRQAHTDTPWFSAKSCVHPS